MDYINRHTKANPKLIMEVISLYLKQTPPLVILMKQSLQDKNWAALGSAAHKMIPSFLIVGINEKFENMAKKVQEYAGTEEHTDEIPELVVQIADISTQACKELEEAFDIINLQTYEERK